MATGDSITITLLPATFDPEIIFNFNKKHGMTEHNFSPDGPVRAHLAKMRTRDTYVWGAFDGAALVGFITLEPNSEYWMETGTKQENAAFIWEFVVDASCRGKGIGNRLTAATVDPVTGIYGVDPSIGAVYTTVHSDNVGSRIAFVKGGYTEVITYTDFARNRATTVLKHDLPNFHAGGPRASAPPSHPGRLRVVGVQSGNAVDGIDVGIFEFEPLVRCENDPRRLLKSLKYTTLANKTFTFTPEERAFILCLRALRVEDGNDYALANYRIGSLLARSVNTLLKESNIPAASVHLIGSHGQTISGHPHWEFGDLGVIAQETGITTAGDFRPADVAQGGNGTPVTCTYDSIMLRPTDPDAKWRVAINVGGTSSVTFCAPWPRAGEQDTAVIRGLDPGLGVFFIDLAARAIDPTLEYDDDGRMARSGTVNQELLAYCLQNKYYQRDSLPIGVGPDDFPETLFAEWQARARSMGITDIDFLCTMVEVSTKQIALACRKFGGPNITGGSTDDVLLRGNVFRNSYFVDRLRANMSEQLEANIDRIKSLADLGLDEESWENAMYAMMGYLCYSNVYNFVPTCTGAKKWVVGGKIAPGDNFSSVTLENFMPVSHI